MAVSRGEGKILLLGHRCDPQVVFWDRSSATQFRLDLAIECGCCIVGKQQDAALRKGLQLGKRLVGISRFVSSVKELD
jgi:hypothetical protein